MKLLNPKNSLNKVETKKIIIIRTATICTPLSYKNRITEKNNKANDKNDPEKTNFEPKCQNLNDIAHS